MIFVEPAAPAAAFANSVGIVTHLPYYDTPYGTRFDEVAKRLEELGVRHVREGVFLGQQLLCDRERALAAHGIRFSYGTQPNLTANDLETWATCTGPAIEGFEGPNEYDIGHPASDTAWAKTLAQFQRSLYDAVKSSPTLRHLRVIGPSLTSGGAFQAVGDLSAYVDYGNIHDYFGTREPGTNGWGDGGYGSIAYNLDIARVTYGRKPIIATESGYGTEDAAGNVTEAVQAAYLPRLLLDHFSAGVVRTDLYELLDEGYEPYSHFGLLRGDLSRKPAFTAIENLIAFFNDDDAASKTAQRSEPPGAAKHDTLRYSITGDVDGLRHALFEKSDGTFELALWVERPSLDAVTRAQLAVPVRTVRVDVVRPATLAPYTFSDSFALVAGPKTRGATSVDLTDRVAFVRIEPR